jgi:tRNA dimethylallyltransferase
MKTLVVLTGPTGVGKTELSLQLAEVLGSPVLSCDSRQIYREIPIGTAAPDVKLLEQVQHYFIGSKSIHEPYSAAKFEVDALSLLDDLFTSHNNILMTGGSMLYIDALCKGIDDMPDINPNIRAGLLKEYKESGLEPILTELKRFDPCYYNQVDKQNHKRVIHGLEICRQTGQAFSSFRKNKAKQRSFRVVKICLDRDRNELYERIDHRVSEMMASGLEQEARSMYPFKHLNALNTVGYKELFGYFDSYYSLEEAVTRIRFNTHKYARKQLTWFRKDSDYHWFHPNETKEILDLLDPIIIA